MAAPAAMPCAITYIILSISALNFTSITAQRPGRILFLRCLMLHTPFFRRFSNCAAFKPTHYLYLFFCRAGLFHHFSCHTSLGRPPLMLPKY